MENRMNRKQFLLMDRNLTEQINRKFRKPGLERILRIISHSGDSLVVVPVLILLWFFKEDIRAALLLPLAWTLGTATGFTFLLKWIFQRARPPHDSPGVTHKTDPYTFPSGHSMRSSAVAFSVLFSGYTPAGILLLLWALIIGAARIAKKMHYLSDILGGYLVGLVCACGVYFLI